MISYGVRRIPRDPVVSGAYRSRGAEVFMDTGSSLISGTDSAGCTGTGESSSSDAIVYDCYGPDGKQWVEYEYPTTSTGTPQEFDLEPLPIVQAAKNPPRKTPSMKERRGCIFSPPGGWGFFKG